MDAPSKIDAPRIPSGLFVWNKYCGQMGYSSREGWDFDLMQPKHGYVIVGWCEAKSLTVRPREEGLAVMLFSEEHQEEFWQHAS